MFGIFWLTSALTAATGTVTRRPIRTVGSSPRSIMRRTVRLLTPPSCRAASSTLHSRASFIEVRLPDAVAFEQLSHAGALPGPGPLVGEREVADKDLHHVPRRVALALRSAQAADVLDQGGGNPDTDAAAHGRSPLRPRLPSSISRSTASPGQSRRPFGSFAGRIP